MDRLAGPRGDVNRTRQVDAIASIGRVLLELCGFTANRQGEFC
jgi:hypothetical protein